VTPAARLGSHLRGHALLFEARARHAYDPRAGVRLLLVFAVLELIVGPRLLLFTRLGLPVPPLWIRVPVLLALALALVRYFAGIGLSQIGLHPWREWTTTEKSYFIQVLLMANVVFAALFAQRLRAALADPSLRGPAVVVLLTYVVWGFHQEVMYRGILQTELVRRWGGLAGILASNALYTFGPLHLYHLSRPRPAPMFAAVFAIGLFFALLFKRSGNLWMAGVFHGIGDAYFTGLGALGIPGDRGSL
jgi:membrane protease YdiL (CAAX protease family)